MNRIYSKNIIFDLDGTLVDSAPGIYLSLSSSLSVLAPEICLSEKSVPIGPPLSRLVEEMLASFPNVDQKNVIDLFKSHYDTLGYKHSYLFSGVELLLETLLSHGYRLFIATNKREVSTYALLGHLKLKDFFTEVVCIDTHGSRFQSKASMLQYLISRHDLCSDTVYVGDRLDDYNAAKVNNIRFAFPMWGYTYELSMIPSPYLKLEVCSLDALMDNLDKSRDDT